MPLEPSPAPGLARRLRAVRVRVASARGAAAWTAMGFTVTVVRSPADETRARVVGVVHVGDVDVVLALADDDGGGGHGSDPGKAPFDIDAWAFDGVPAGGTSGVKAVAGVDVFEWPPSRGYERRAVEHANKAVGVDHVVLAAAAADADVVKRELSEKLGAGVRGERKVGSATQLFFRPGGGVVLEVVVGMPMGSSSPPSSMGVLWGLTLVVSDIEAAKKFLGDDGASKVRQAVQPGRRILTVRHAHFGSRVNLALMTPHVKSPVPEKL